MTRNVILSVTIVLKVKKRTVGYFSGPPKTRTKGYKFLNENFTIIIAVAL